MTLQHFLALFAFTCFGAVLSWLIFPSKERDEARREVCGLLVACHTDPDDEEPDPNLKHIHAGIRGWDCFKEDKEDTDD